MSTILPLGTESKDAIREKSEKGLNEEFPEDFKAIQNPIVNFLLPLVPWLSFFMTGLLLILKNMNFFNDRIIIAWLPIIISGYFIAGMSLYSQRIFAKKIPEFFRELWNRKIILDTIQLRFNSGNINDNDSKVIDKTLYLKNEYFKFIDEIQKRLNNSWQFLFGIFGIMLTLLWNPIRTLNNFPLLWKDSLALPNHWNNTTVWQFFIQDNWHFLNEVPVSLIAFMLGLMIWRMYVASRSINKLVDKFKLEPKFGHQDMAGGLSPLGNLCLWNCTIASFPSIYISIWLLMGNLNNFPSPYPNMPNYYTYEFLILLFFLSIFPLVFCFIKPLRKVHQQMNDWREYNKTHLYKISHEIHKKESELLLGIEEIKHDELINISKELETLKNIYIQYKRLPVWPVNIRILGQLFTIYMLPIISMISMLVQIIYNLHNY